MLLHTIGAPATELDTNVNETDEEPETQILSDVVGPGPGPSRALTLPYLTPGPGEVQLLMSCLIVLPYPSSTLPRGKVR